MSGKIFLNYRRDDSRWPSLSLYNWRCLALMLVHSDL